MSRAEQHCDDKARKRILLLAYACSPYKGSESGVGWHRAAEAAKYFDTFVLYGMDEYRRDIKRYIDRHGEIPGLHFFFIPETAFGKPMWRLPLGYGNISMR